MAKWLLVAVLLFVVMVAMRMSVPVSEPATQAPYPAVAGPLSTDASVEKPLAPEDRGKIWMGMTTSQAAESVKRPPDRDVQIVVGDGYTDEFWHYDGGMLHFRDGRLAGWSGGGQTPH